MHKRQPRAFIFDLDGTLYLGDKIIPGAAESLKWVREQGGLIRFVTNNPRFSKKLYYDKLNNLGIEAKIEEIVTSANLAASFLSQNPSFGKVFVIGEEQLESELHAAGVTVTEQSDADTVLVSFDTGLTYEKLMIAYHALQNGAHFMATNPDSVCPTPDGGLVDAGAIIAALEASTGRQIERVIGKPSKLLGDLLVDQLGVPRENCVITGDRLNTDVRLGKNAGMQTVWIRANDEPMPENSEESPDYILKSIAELPEAFSKDF